jgi:restriction system protein
MFLKPGSLVAATPEEFEAVVQSWIRRAGARLTDFRVEGSRKLRGSSGEYQFDAVATFSAFRGARFVVLVECKRLSRPVERKELLALESKRQDVGAHKAIIFSIGGYQAGAIEYASARGIATVHVVDGRAMYCTRSQDEQEITANAAAQLGIGKFAGWWISQPDGDGLTGTSMEFDDPNPLAEWLARSTEKEAIHPG